MGRKITRRAFYVEETSRAPRGEGEANGAHLYNRKLSSFFYPSRGRREKKRERERGEKNFPTIPVYPFAVVSGIILSGRRRRRREKRERERESVSTSKRA